MGFAIDYIVVIMAEFKSWSGDVTGLTLGQLSLLAITKRPSRSVDSVWLLEIASAVDFLAYIASIGRGWLACASVR